jgi:hypothetical protein
LSKKNDLRQKPNSPPVSPLHTFEKTDSPSGDLTNKNIDIEENLPNRPGASANKVSGIPTTQKQLIRRDEATNPEKRFTRDENRRARQAYGNRRLSDQLTPTGPSARNQKASHLNLSDKELRAPAGELEIKTSVPNFRASNIASEIDVSIAVDGPMDQFYYKNLFPEQKSAAELKQQKNKSQKAKDILASQNKNIAVGFSLPLGFPLGDQKPGAFNINARPNVISDFLPVPHMQYHVNNKLYLQTEVQLMNPQYIQPVLLFQQKSEVASTNTTYYNSVYAKKLYYFNIPVGVHYSPFHHFYLGTGLQFSSLVSGVALHERTKSVGSSNRYDLVSQSYSRFKNDTISNRIDNNEFRLMLDANYYWRQFTVGLRYNQALSNYVSFRLNSASPLFQDKNKSLQFYLRYNLWENHKKPSSLAKFDK